VEEEEEELSIDKERGRRAYYSGRWENEMGLRKYYISKYANWAYVLGCSFLKQFHPPCIFFISLKGKKIQYIHPEIFLMQN
jgi:hypothetical protein